MILDGLKTKIAGGGLILTGIAKVIEAVLPLASGGSVDGAALNEGWLILMNGLGVFGIGHKIEKLKGDK